jgi:glutamate 5-kinase
MKGDGQPILRQHIKSIQGPYVKGDVIHIYDESGAEIARGLSNFTAEETMVLARNAKMPVRQLLGYHSNGTVISQENLVILEDRHLLWESPGDAKMVNVAA